MAFGPEADLHEHLRLQILILLEVNHHYFEDILEVQHPLGDAFTVLDAIGW